MSDDLDMLYDALCSGMDDKPKTITAKDPESKILPARNVFVEIKHPSHSENRPATKQEIIAGEKLYLEIKAKRAVVEKYETQRNVAQQILDKALSKCTHDLFYDEASFIYDRRFCAVCGMSKGLI